MEIIGYHIDKGIIANSRGETCTEAPWLEFLLKDGKPDTIQCLYHMDWNVACLLRNWEFTEEQGRRLYDKGSINLRGTGYKLTYYPGKYFAIDYGGGAGKRFALFSNMHQYEKPELDYTFSPLSRAEAAKNTGEAVYKALTDISLHPKTLTSPIAAYDKEVLREMNLPTVDDIPFKAGEMAYECCSGGWLEAFQRGHWEQVWDYDINSAYPNQLSLLPDTRQGRWQQSTIGIPEAKIGFARGMLEIKPEVNFHPFFYRAEKERDMSYTPVGRWPTTLTMRQLIFLYKWELGTFDIEEGWWWTPYNGHNCSHPLKEEIKRLHWEKMQAQGLKREVVKRIPNGIYGKLLEVHQYEGEGEEMGLHFNPVWGAEVEVNTRLAVAELAMSSGVLPLHIAVDGVVVDRELGIEPNGKKLGGWKLSAKGKGLVLGSGVVALQGKKGEGDFSLDYYSLYREMRDKPLARYFTMKKLSPWSLAKCLNLGHWDKLGDVEEVERGIDVCSEAKRCYREMGENAGEVLEKQVESVPWDISMVKEVL